MIHYPHYITDFNNATRHLTRVERSLYRDATELYYETELPLIDDIDFLNRKLIARSDEEKEALLSVLSEFFNLVDGKYVHHRCEEEILKFHNMTSSKSIAGKASAAAKAKRKAERLASKKQQDSTGVKQVLKSVATEPQQNSTNQNQNQNQFKSIVGQAKQAIDYLNKKCGSDFRHVDSNIDLVKARFKQGYSIDDVIAVIDSKCNEWIGTESAKYLRPATIFGKEKFSQYHGQVGLSINTSKTDLAKLSNEELFKMAEGMSIHTQGLYRNDLISAIQAKPQ